MIERYDSYAALDVAENGSLVEFEDFEKLLKLAEQMLDDLIGEGMYTQKYEDEMKLIRGDR
jgi:hypothetical protein